MLPRLWLHSDSQLHADAIGLHLSSQLGLHAGDEHGSF